MHVLASLPQEQRVKVIQSMLAFVYAHRHNKDDLFIKETMKDKYIDFSIVRDVQYSYSKKAQDKFFSHAIESYFLAKFAMSPEGQTYIIGKDSSKKEASDKVRKLLKDTADLKDLAIESLQQAQQSGEQNKGMI